MRRRRPPEVAEEGLFRRPAWAWAELGLTALFGDGPPTPPATPWASAWQLCELGALSDDELSVLRAAAAGDVPDWLDCNPVQAASLLARWSGPIRGLKLRPLPHWRNNLRAVH